MSEGWTLTVIILAIVLLICGTSALNHYLDYRTAIIKAEAEYRKTQTESNARIQAAIEETKRWELVLSMRNRKMGM